MEPRLLDMSLVVSTCREMLKWTDSQINRRFKSSGICEGALLRLLYSPRLLYDKPSRSFHEGLPQVAIVKTDSKHELRGSLNCLRQPSNSVNDTSAKYIDIHSDSGEEDAGSIERCENRRVDLEFL
ncbi:hypothetical protein V5O48_011680 [Marasmius crinis-equi]|uniref:Uncharacterized protein n=1 Tax=Marasmius crinis-equi TaxID=585013 RepID=A0ABR3F4W8_9AGAR